MLSSAGFHDLVSGRRRGVSATILRGMLRAAEAPYAAAVLARNSLYDRGLLASEPAPVPVVSVGNLTLGGTGKTPLVRWLAGWFSRRRVRIGLVSRGYRGTGEAGNDEARELAHYLPGVPHVQHRDRVLAAREIVARHGCQLLLLDDGFQHRRLRRDLDLVLLDALQPFGFDHVFPRGTLREQVAGLDRCHVVVLSRSDLVEEDERATIRQRAAELAPRADWVEIAHRPAGLLAADGRTAAVGELAGRQVAAFCGLGNPQAFRRTLQQAGLAVARFRAFPDHHAFSDHDLDQLTGWARADSAVEAVMCSHKDLVKIERQTLGDLPLWALSVEVAVLRGGAQLERHLEQVCPGGSAVC